MPFLAPFIHGNPTHFVPSNEERKLIFCKLHSDIGAHSQNGNESTDIVYSVFIYSKTSVVTSVSRKYEFKLLRDEVCISIFAKNYDSVSAQILKKFVSDGTSAVVLKTFSEQKIVNDALTVAGFSFLTCQSAKSGEMFSYYVAPTNRPANIKLLHTNQPPNCVVLKSNSIDRFKDEIEFMQLCKNKFISLDKSSNYRDTWLMLALRSVDGRSTTLNCPLEENSRAQLVLSTYQWTEIASNFPLLVQWIKLHWNEEDVLRVRFSLLLSGGKILRHADKANKSNGMKPNPRFHFVLRSNSECVFNSLNIDGVVVPCVMKEGNLLSVNNCFPHWVENNGMCDRYHLIIDTKCNSRNKT